MSFYEHTFWIKTPDRLKDHLLDQENKKINLLGPFQKINVIIGTNNSGKSLLMRELIRQLIDKTYVSDRYLNNLNKKIVELRNNICQVFNGQMKSFYSNNGEFSFYDIDTHIPFIEEKSPLEDNIAAIDKAIKIAAPGFDRFGTTSGYTHIQSNNRGNIVIKNTLSTIKKDLENLLISKTYSKIYIPTIRTLRVYKDNQELENKTREEYSFNRTENQLDQNIDSNIIIENGQSFYDQISYLRNSTHEEEEKLFRYQEFLSEFFFDKNKVSFITNKKDKIINIKIGDEKAQPIQHLGDGLQMIIIITFPFFNYNNGIVMIEEPELFIHPSLQQTLMNVLSNSKLTDNFQTFIVTHSNHIINFSTHNSRASIFNIKKATNNDSNSLPKFVFSNISYGDTSILDLIGANKSSVFLSNCSIWVEGVTDKLYLLKIIEKYCSMTTAKKHHKGKFKLLREGLHYIFVYSAGDNIIHLDFDDVSILDEISRKVPIKFLCGKAMVIIDDDNGKNIARKNALKNKLKFNLVVLNSAEIENILSPKTILDTIKEYPTIKSLNINNDPIIKYSDYQFTKLGTYIDDNLLPEIFKLNNINQNKKIKSFRKDKLSKNSTINSKVEFCEFAMKHIHENELTDEAIRVAQAIMDFIIKNNPQLK